MRLVLIGSEDSWYRLPSDAAKRITRQFPRVEVLRDDNAQEVDAVFAWEMDARRIERVLRANPSLRWVHIAMAGVPPPLIKALEGHPAVLTNSKTHGQPLAEWAVGAVLAHYKRFDDLSERKGRREWPERYEVEELAGRTAGIVGLGDLGLSTARLLRCFGVRVLGVRRGENGLLPEEVDVVYPRADLQGFLRELDVLVLAAPLTAETRGMIGATELAWLKPGAYLVNISRGALVDEAALVGALRSGQLSGAALDVFAREPLPAESPLWDLPGVRISPHSADRTPATVERTLAFFEQNLRRVLAGEPPHNVVDRARGY